METLTIEITNMKAHGLLEELENLEIIKILKQDKPERPSLKLRGKMDAKWADELSEYVAKSRMEWEEKFPTS